MVDICLFTVKRSVINLLKHIFGLGQMINFLNNAIRQKLFTKAK